MPESKYETKDTVFDREHAVYTMTSYVNKATGEISHHELTIQEKDSESLLSTTFMVVDKGSDIVDIILNTEKKLQLTKLLNEFTQEMEVYTLPLLEKEGYSYYGSNPGISADDYEDVADRILEKFFLK